MKEDNKTNQEQAGNIRENIGHEERVFIRKYETLNR